MDKTRLVMEALAADARDKTKEIRDRPIPHEARMAVDVLASSREGLETMLTQLGPARMANIVGKSSAGLELQENLAAFLCDKAIETSASDLRTGVETACRLIVAGNIPLVPSQVRAVSFVASKLGEFAKSYPAESVEAATILQLHAPDTPTRQLATRHLLGNAKELGKRGDWDGAYRQCNNIMMASRQPLTSAERMTVTFMGDHFLKALKSMQESLGLTAILMVGFGESREQRIGENFLEMDFTLRRQANEIEAAAMTARIIMISGTDKKGKLYATARDFLLTNTRRLDSYGRKATEATFASTSTWRDAEGTQRAAGWDRMAGRYSPDVIFDMPENADEIIRTTLERAALNNFKPEGPAN